MELKKFTLKRDISLLLLVFYGLGNILGAGIYVLIGEIASISGFYMPFSFILACVVVFFTALSYAELSSRYPYSAGEALYAKHAFNSTSLSIIIGLMIAISGILSSATIVHGFNGYLSNFINVPIFWTSLALVTVLGFVAIIGIKHSVGVATVLTLIEIAGLLVVVFVGVDNIVWAKVDVMNYLPPLELNVWYVISLGAFLAFYAFIGFEDMVNIAEEVKLPQKTFPKAIILSLIMATVIYMAVAFISVVAVPIESLASSSAPLAYVYEQITHNKPVLLTLIGMFAVVNGALVQIIMVSRILYGMSMNGWLPESLSQVHEKTRTPVIATLLTSLAVLLFTVWLPILTLASFTSFFIFIIFTLMNVALIKLKIKTPHPKGVKTFPMFIPIVGTVVNIVLLGVQLISLM